MVGAKILMFLAIVGTSLAKPQFPGGGGVSGGLSSIFSADFDENLQYLVGSVKHKAEEILNFPIALSKFEPKGYKKQTVAGTVYFVKVNIGTPRFGQTQDDWILLRIYEDLSGCACLENLEQNVGQFSSINHMDKLYSCDACNNNGDNNPAPGSLDNTRSADSSIRNLVRQAQNDIEFRLGYRPNRLEPVSYKEQTVAGTNYFVKVNIGLNRPGQTQDDYIHLRIHEDFSGCSCLENLKPDETQFSEINYDDNIYSCNSCATG